MPPRERAARERQLRQEAAETRRIAEAEEEAARIAASNGGVVRRNPDGGHGEGTLAARNAANILAQLLGAFGDSSSSTTIMSPSNEYQYQINWRIIRLLQYVQITKVELSP